MAWAWGFRKLWMVRRARLAAGSLTDRLLGSTPKWAKQQHLQQQQHQHRGQQDDLELDSLASLKQSSRQKRQVVCGFLVSVLLALAFGAGLASHYGLLRARDDHGPIIDLGYTQYRGTYLDRNISEFLGMRFAQPPTGDLRWRAPIDPEPTEGIHRAKDFGPLCLPIGVKPSKAFGEDCLFANVWAPTNATTDMKLPVMVFIQGGGYTQLASPNWNGSQLVDTSDRGMVFVNFNYRVGLWGFLAGEEVRRDGNLNAGLLDQRFVLEWIQKHISKFGGDPDHVVIQGISAGAGSVALHLASYGGRDDGLYVGAIAESVFFPAQPLVSDLEYQLNRTMDDAGCTNEQDRMSCLRSLSTKKLQRLNQALPFPGQLLLPLFYWTPCIDGDFLQDLPYKMFENGNFVNVPLLAGACTNEGSVFAPSARNIEDITIFFQAQYPRLTATDMNDMLAFYPLEPSVPKHDLWFPTTSRAYGEATFICPTTHVLNSFASEFSKSVAEDPEGLTPSNIWSYRYDVVDEDIIANGLGVPHVFEGPAVFGPTMLPSWTIASGYWSYNAPVVPIVMKYWLSFVITLDPNTFKDDNAPPWEPWGNDQNRLVIQTDDSVMETIEPREAVRCDFWKGMADITQQ